MFKQVINPNWSWKGYTIYWSVKCWSMLERYANQRNVIIDFQTFTTVLPLLQQ